MAAPVPATDLATALFNINLNIHSLYEGGTDIKARLILWKDAFFPTIDKNDASQAFIHRWIVPTLALEQELSSVLTWFQVEDVINLMNSTLASARWNGYLPAGAQETAMVLAFNNAWT